MAAVVFSIRLERRENYGIRAAACAAAAVCMGVLSESLFRNSYAPAAVLSPVSRNMSIAAVACLYSLAIVAVIVGMLLFTCRITPIEAVYAATCAYLAEHIAYCVRILADAATGTGAAEDASHWSYWVIHAAVYASAYWLFARKMTHHGHYYAAPGRTIGLLVYAILVILVLSVLSSLGNFRVLHAAYALAFSVFVLFSQIDRQQQVAAQEESAVRGQMLIAQQEQYDLYRENIRIVDRKCHDLRHQAGRLLKRAEGEEQKEEIKALMRAIMIYDTFVRTGSRELDTILTQKNEICRREDIALTCVADGKALRFIDPANLFTIFEWLFDLAIGEVRKIPAGHRRIHLTVSGKMQLVIIAVEYPAGMPGNRTATAAAKDPADRETGRRLMHSLELALEPYDGTVQRSGADGMTVLRVVLQTPEEGT